MSHTPGPLTIDSYDTIRTRDGERFRMTGVSLPTAVVDINDTAFDNGRLAAAAYTSYDKHFGPRAVEAAEGDYLGRLIAIGRDLSQSTDLRTPPMGLHVRIDNILSTTKGNA